MAINVLTPKIAQDIKRVAKISMKLQYDWLFTKRYVSYIHFSIDFDFIQNDHSNAKPIIFYTD